ncbi:MAG TPA: hypothetical protein VF746_30540 [Longimicrobium sp.]|jgi:hypothetical protein
MMRVYTSPVTSLSTTAPTVRIDRVTPIFRVEYTEGEVREINCDTSTDEGLYEVGYTPYEDGSPTPSTCGGGTGGSGTTGEDPGSGTQFYPGDYTGGETVDWETGKGNGGTSACGDKAVVEYVCIDVYNEETGQWEQWSCGYATTC